MSTPAIAIFGIGAFGAVAAEAIRIKLMNEQLLNELNSKKRRSEANPQKGIIYPKWYWTSALVYACVGGVLACLLPHDANLLYFFYVGAALPKFVSLTTSALEKQIPGAIAPATKPTFDEGETGPSVDDTSVEREGRMLYRVDSSRFRSLDGLFRYLTG